MEREASSRSPSIQKHDSVSHEAHQAAADGKVKEPPPIPPARGQEHEAVLVAPDDKSVKPDKDAKGVTGRKKYKGGEHWDVASGKQAPVGGKKNLNDEETEEDEVGKKGQREETEEEHEIEIELNSILKKGPSKFYAHAKPNIWLCRHFVTMTDMILSTKSSSSPNPTAPIRKKQKISFWKNTPSYRHHTLQN